MRAIFRQQWKLQTALAVLSLAALPVLAAGWTDRGEYDLALAIRSEALPKKRLELLDAWTNKYPKTELLQARLALYLSAYEYLSDKPHMLDIARQMFANQPDSPVALYWCTVMVPEAPNSTPEILDLGGKAARGLLAGLNTFFSPGRKPATVSDADWLKQKATVEILGHRTLAWVAWRLANYPEAEKELTTCLEKDPQNPEMAAWMGMVLGLEKGKEVQALWHLSRAVAPGRLRGLPSEQRREVSAVLEQVYASYHGALDGFDQLQTASAASVFPAANFSIESAQVIAARRAEEQFRRDHPELATWLDMRKRLESADGEQYFAETLRLKDLPRLKGRVIKCTPERYPKEIILSMDDEDTAGSVTLKLKMALPNGAEPGTEILFQGTADAFTREPFGVVVAIEKDKIEGWPEKASSKGAQPR